jgi:putative flavoprotein involved in K+ transport
LTLRIIFETIFRNIKHGRQAKKRGGPLANWSDATAPELRQVAVAWLAMLEAALARKDHRHIAAMMHGDGYWRDLLAFGWEFKTLHGVDAVGAWQQQTAVAHPARDFHLEREPTIGSLLEHEQTLEFFFRFETDLARSRGYARLVPDPTAPDGFKAMTVLTALHELKKFPQASAHNRRREDLRMVSRRPDNWLDHRNAARQFADQDPEVVIIGGGQSGLMMAARLGQLNVDTLVAEKTDRVGDVWRHRYHSLCLHNEICMNHFAYMPFPDTWPVFIPKDKLADWLEFYADAMELNVWTKTTLLLGEYDDAARRWTVRLRLADGSIRTMRPSHVVLAAGVSGLPNIPKFPGMDEFGGPIVHSSGNTDELDAKGKSVLVVGAGTSGHDIAQQLHWRGAEVTMLQRSSVTVVSLEPSSVRPYELYRKNDSVLPIDDTDLIAASVPYPLLARLHKPLSKRMAEDDKALLDGLRKVGFLLDNGEDDTGYFLKLLRYQAGYYLNIGASDLIVEGAIKLKSGVDIARLKQRQVIFSDGTSLDADIVVLATGYKPLQEAVRQMFGDQVADRVGPIWGIGSDGELCSMYARTAQAGFFVSGGGIPGARAYSHYTALLIKAALEGLIPERASPPRPADTSERRGEPASAGVHV